MVVCKSCGGSDFKDEGYHIVCQQCGNVDDMLHLVSDTKPLMSSFMKYERHDDRSPAFRNFEDLYRYCTQTVNTPRAITDQGILMLPQMWEDIKNKGNKTKKLYVFALLYLLYRQHQIPVTFRQFLKRAHVSQERLSVSGIVQYLMKQFNLTMSKDMNVADITSNNISELVKLVFKNSTGKMESDTVQPAQRLVNVIYQKEWGDTSSKNYIALVSIISTLLSAQFVLSNMTHRKTKHGRNASFRVMTINYQKMADHMCVHVMAVKRCLKVVQKKLFDLVNKLPWTAACIKRSYDVALVLGDILNYIDIDLQHDDHQETPLIPYDVKLTILDAVETYISMHREIMQQVRPLIDSGKFMDLIYTKLDLEDSKSKENIVMCNNGEFAIEGFVIKFHYVELLKDLLLSGCTVTELLNENYIKLVEKYIDMRDVNNEDDMEDMTEEEMAIYFKNPSLFMSSSDSQLLDVDDKFQTSEVNDLQLSNDEGFKNKFQTSEVNDLQLSNDEGFENKLLSSEVKM